jgi:isopentenyldiphosphate isomerase
MILIVTNYMEVEIAITRIALVNENDQIVSYEDKLKVHRAFSVFVVNGKGQ